MPGKWTPDTGSNPRDQGVDEPVAATPGVSGETGLRLPRSGMADSADAVERLPTGVINAADAVLKEGRRRRPSFRT